LEKQKKEKENNSRRNDRRAAARNSSIRVAVVVNSILVELPWTQFTQHTTGFGPKVVIITMRYTENLEVEKQQLKKQKKKRVFPHGRVFICFIFPHLAAAG